MYPPVLPALKETRLPSQATRLPEHEKTYPRPRDQLMTEARPTDPRMADGRPRDPRLTAYKPIVRADQRTLTGQTLLPSHPETSSSQNIPFETPLFEPHSSETRPSETRLSLICSRSVIPSTGDSQLRALSEACTPINSNSGASLHANQASTAEQPQLHITNSRATHPPAVTAPEVPPFHGQLTLSTGPSDTHLEPPTTQPLAQSTAIRPSETHHSKALLGVSPTSTQKTAHAAENHPLTPHHGVSHPPTVQPMLEPRQGSFPAIHLTIQPKARNQQTKPDRTRVEVIDPLRIPNHSPQTQPPPPRTHHSSSSRAQSAKPNLQSLLDVVLKKKENKNIR